MSIDGTMMGRIRHWASERPDQGALFSRAGADGDWDTVTWQEYWNRVRKVGRGLIGLGVQPGSSVAMIADNCPEWVICQHGVTAAGAVLNPIYTTSLTSQVAYIVGFSESRVVILDNEAQLAKIREAQSEGEIEIDHIITIRDLGVDDADVITMADLEARADETPEAELDARLDAVTPDDVALRVYTSGTTGLPKGAELTNKGIRAVTNSIVAVTDSLFEGQQRGVSYLPLCHAAEQIFTNFIALHYGSQYYFCPSLEQLRDYLTAVKPTVLLGVPRVWEKFEDAIRAQVPNADEIDEPTAEFIRQVLGIEEVQMAISGAAPISESTLAFFERLGLTIYECYGMTETTGAATIPPVGATRIGTVGKPIPGVEVRLSDEGELLLRGDNMVRNYHKLPEQTAELWDGDWMRTGDLATIDDDGYISITGRAKDLLITAGGKNVGPVEMENLLGGVAGVDQAIAVGDRKPYLTALLTVSSETLPALLEAAGVAEPLSAEEAAGDERVLSYLREQVDEQCNAHVARYQQIKYFDVLPVPFSEEAGELTPTMKLKRNVVTEKYADRIEQMYAGATA